MAMMKALGVRAASLSRFGSRWLLAWSAIVVGLASLPYALGYVLAPPNMAFMGLLPYFSDASSYLAKMMEGLNGHWLFYLPYTSEEHAGAPLFLTYLLLGKLAMATNLSSIIVFHLARIVGGFLLLLLCYRFMVEFLRNRAATRLAFLLACLIGGAGWTTYLIPVAGLIGDLPPVDLTRTDTTLFWSLYSFPHHILGIGLLLLAVWAAHLAFARGTLRATMLAGILAAASGFVHPSYPAVVISIVVVYVCLRVCYSKRLDLSLVHGSRPLAVNASSPSVRSHGFGDPLAGVWRRLIGVASLIQGTSLSQWGVLGIIAVPSLLSVLYQRYLIAGNWALAVWQEQSSGNGWPVGFGQYAFAYGPLAVLAVVGVPSYLRRYRNRGLFIISWAVAVPVLVVISYWAKMVPLAHGLSRATIGWTVPLSMLAAVGLRSGLVPLLARVKKGRRGTGVRTGRLRWRRAWFWAVSLTFLVGVPSTAVVLANGLITDSRHERPYFLNSDEVAALEWLRRETNPDNVVLSGTLLGSLVPARAGNRVYLGHAVETLYEQQKAAEVASFYRGEMGDSEQERFLRQNKIRFVLLGHEERALGGGELKDKTFLRQVFGNAAVSIYQVEENQPAAGGHDANQ